jgi:hypothetical protein
MPSSIGSLDKDVLGAAQRRAVQAITTCPADQKELPVTQGSGSLSDFVKRVELLISFKTAF